LRRIVVVGNAGSGKTTLADLLARRLGLRHVELDALHWEADWTMAPTDVFRERVAAALAGDRWVTDGNYSKVRDLTWGRADTIVWLDYSLPRTMGRLMRRTVRRIARSEELWNGNRERWSNFFSRDSILLWALTTHRRRRRDYGRELPTAPHQQLFRLRSPRQARRWLATVTAKETVL
jgi:adenylate kinase family enzyme